MFKLFEKDINHRKVEEIETSDTARKFKRERENSKKDLNKSKVIRSSAMTDIRNYFQN